MTVEIASSTEPAVWNAVNFGRCCIDVPPSLRCLIGRAMYYEGRLRAGSIPDPQPRARAISRRSNSTFRNLSCIPPRQAIVSWLIRRLRIVSVFPSTPCTIPRRYDLHPTENISIRINRTIEITSTKITYLYPEWFDGLRASFENR